MNEYQLSILPLQRFILVNLKANVYSFKANIRKHTTYTHTYGGVYRHIKELISSENNVRIMEIKIM